MGEYEWVVSAVYLLPVYQLKRYISAWIPVLISSHTTVAGVSVGLVSNHQTYWLLRRDARNQQVVCEEIFQYSRHSLTPTNRLRRDAHDYEAHCDSRTPINPHLFQHFIPQLCVSYHNYRTVVQYSLQVPFGLGLFRLASRTATLIYLTSSRRILMIMYYYYVCKILAFLLYTNHVRSLKRP